MWLTNCQLVDVESGSVRPGAAVRIEGDRIVACEDGTSGWASADATERYDLGGRFLLPGIISCHTHLSVVYPFQATDEAENAGITALRAASGPVTHCSPGSPRSAACTS